MSGRPVTAEARWSEPLATRVTAAADLFEHRRIVVVAAHPDDETLALGGFLQAYHDEGGDLTLVVATRGELAFPAADHAEQGALARERTGELTKALRALGAPDTEVRWLDLPDSGLADHERELTDRLRPLLRDADCVLAPWPLDPHPDHAAAGRAALAAAPITAHRWSYPIWMWHWTDPVDSAIPWTRAARIPLTPTRQRRKAVALAAFASQLRPGPRGEPAILDRSMLAHFARDHEVVFREPREDSAPVERFGALYGANADPWDTRSSWYERRKRQVVLASLPREHYRLAIEPGCGTGALTVQLQERCDRVLAFDPVPEAVAAARAAGARAVTVAAVPADMPADLPDVRADLVVCSEILYYLSDVDLKETVAELVSVLEPGGDFVAVHWRGWPAEAPRDAVATHAVLTEHPALRTVVEHTDEEFLLHVLRRS
ncbi:bifunctional PIG-L family deacetylase/class I SAM-dependent methyltransferase [Labedaea rhizosphaerae]|uniref:LmbE family N-acetylglucosaminyl deacetylase n=1 Tax=Labedaea rhizosphaerae TaxID=598644 RepID=A0A4R6SHA5_LABRH|nr:bifunctional PIG-L family deacetylase/class I SAM-dependent methyltransferase [Labedaea rhizosphaerae]TDQ00736.1 LmbE family N-acetylglucosaminyl deacetylase [Labedaea rhizosphaerae]